MKSLFNYFLRGLLFVFPLGATLYIIIASIRWSNRALNGLLFQWLNIDIPGLGIITVLVGVTIIGYIFSNAFTRPFLNFFERLLSRVPLVKIIYTSIKELTEAFVGDKKRFNKPVLVEFKGTNIKRIGFITQSDLSELDLQDTIAVYCPHSYNVSGNLYLVPKQAVSPLNLHATEVMKYVVSAGITRIARPE